jgi:hypothetical protein
VPSNARTDVDRGIEVRGAKPVDRDVRRLVTLLRVINDARHRIALQTDFCQDGIYQVSHVGRGIILQRLENLNDLVVFLLPQRENVPLAHS